MARRSHASPTRRKLDLHQRLELVTRICDAVQYAHQQGVVHRDLKPGNILVDSTGQPKILDFGIAKITANETQLSTMETQVGQLVGTLPYMSPEQARGEVDKLDTRSDIYALGVIAYELLAGKLPYDLKQAVILEAVRVICEEEPTPLSSIDRRFGGDVETMIAKAMAKEKERRYASVSEMATDIRRFLNDEPIAARPPTAWYQINKFARRNKVLVGGVVAVLVVLIVGVIAASTGWARATSQSRLAREQASRAEQAEGIAVSQQRDAENASRIAKEQRVIAEKKADDLRRELDAHRITQYMQSIALAQRELPGNITAASKLLNDCPTDLREWEWRHLQRRLDASYATLLVAEGSITHHVDWSRDGRFVLATDGALVHVWDAKTHKPLQSIGDKEALWCARFSSSGSRLATGSQDSTLKIYDSASGKLLTICRGHSRYVAALSWSPNDDRVVTGGTDNTTRIWDTRTGEQLIALPGHDQEVRRVAWSPDGKWIATASYDRKIQLFDASTGRLTRSIPHQGNGVECMAWSPDSRSIAIGDQAKRLRIFDADTGAETMNIAAHDGFVFSVAWSPDGRSVVTASGDKTMKLWDVQSKSVIATLRGHEGSVSGVAWSPDGERVISGSQGKAVKLWRVRDASLAVRLLDHEREIADARWSANGKQIACGGFNCLRTWTFPAGETALVQVAAFDIRTVAWSPDSNRLAVGLGGGVTLFEPKSLGKVATLALPPKTGDTVVWSPDGKHLAAGGSSNCVTTWSVADDRPGPAFPTEDAWVSSLSWSPDGSAIVAGFVNNKVRVYDAGSGRLRHNLVGHEGWVTSVTWSPDGTRVITASRDKTARVWDVKTAIPVLTLEGFDTSVNRVACSPDGKRIGTGTMEGVKIWDVVSGRQVLTLTEAQGVITALAWSPDGRFLMAGGSDKKLVIWDAGPSEKRD